MTTPIKKAERLADQYFDSALSLAASRELSGAAELLRACLKIRKDHPQARDLLGLVLYEAGEVGEALTQWIISRDLLPEGELAARYIDEVQRDTGRLRQLEGALIHYNRALENCREGHDDLAAVELRRALNQNPNLVKAWQLQALIDIRNSRFAQARRMVRRAYRIDAGSEETRHLLRLIDQESRSREERLTRAERRAEKKEEKENSRIGRAKLSPVNRSFFNILIGAALGLLATWVLFVPARLRSMNSQMNRRIVEYTNTIAGHEQQIRSLQGQIAEMTDVAEKAQADLEVSGRAADSYVLLLQAYEAYSKEDFEAAGDAIVGVDETLLAEEAQEIYNSIINEVTENAYTLFSEKGLSAFDNGDYAASIPLLEKAVALQEDDYTVLNRLAHAYRYTGDAANALKYFQKIVDLYPDSRRAESVMRYLEEMKDLVEQQGGTVPAETDGGAQDAGGAGDAAETAEQETGGEDQTDDEG